MISAPSEHNHSYVCNITKNVCWMCGHVEGTPEFSEEDGYYDEMGQIGRI